MLLPARTNCYEAIMIDTVATTNAVETHYTRGHLVNAIRIRSDGVRQRRHGCDT